MRGGVFGELSHMNLVSTAILTLDNKTMVVPNGSVIRVHASVTRR